MARTISILDDARWLMLFFLDLRSRSAGLNLCMLWEEAAVCCGLPDLA